MKYLMFVVSLILYCGTTSFAQNPEVPGPWGRMGGKIEQLEKIKLIEELNLDEETAVRFFARRNEHRDLLRSIIKERDSLYEKLSQTISSNNDVNLNEKLNEIFKIEEKMVLKRREFIESLDDIFTNKQQTQLVLFEFYFRKEMRKQFMKQGKRRMKHMKVDEK